jgi:hypothetical protein
MKDVLGKVSRRSFIGVVCSFPFIDCLARKELEGSISPASPVVDLDNCDWPPRGSNPVFVLSDYRWRIIQEKVIEHVYVFETPWLGLEPDLVPGWRTGPSEFTWRVLKTKLTVIRPFDRNTEELFKLALANLGHVVSDFKILEQAFTPFFSATWKCEVCFFSATWKCEVCDDSKCVKWEILTHPSRDWELMT